ncbi:MAG: hypothetical protein JNM64_03720, partial [Chloroflexia bacterium]|nr:hypothetical protein [Chloroflexia bacterium]
AQSCKFVNRCPHAMEICRTQSPPLYRTEEHRAAACFLYQDAPQLASAELDAVLVQPERVPAGV